ncbi:MAG: radical SAM protein [Bacteroidetes bacterium]|nr:radical SAM protein [Bacteroidota bacterium]MCL5034428.1 radical SAM protein [Bacteroidota bacterium]
MKSISAFRNLPAMARVFVSNPQMVLVRPALTRFMCSYMNKFKVRNVGRNLILHSHLPPLNSKAYSRFVDEHLIARTIGPSHAQIAITNQCPQNCNYCYNKSRSGRVMETETIIDIARQLRDMGVVWLGLTGGEPLLNRDIVRIVESVSADCAVKLFTTGCTLTNQLAVDLKNAGLFSVSVSLDHWDEKVHDAARNYRGAFREALRAIEVFKSIGGIDVGVSAVLTPEMIRSNQTGEFVRFLETLGVHEAWLSEVKPTAEVFREEKWIITEQDRLKVLDFQDRHNARGGMTVNYLGHFEGRECFGCNAGHKMVYVDAFGIPMPPWKGHDFHALLGLYALFTNERAEDAVRLGLETATKERLYRGAYRMGQRLREDFGVKSVKDVMKLSRIIYNAIEIDFRGDANGEIVISRCFFGSTYSPSVCSFMSALDAGILSGLSAGGRLAFQQRITSGDICCRAQLSFGQKTQ